MYTSDVEGLDAFAKRYAELKKEIAKVIVGQEDIVSKLLISIFAMVTRC
jgi:MoxR-like ATPase